MKCKACSSQYPAPEIIDGTAYFVCADCGDVSEVKNYREYTSEERLSEFENLSGFKLPPQYSQYAGRNDSWVAKLPSTDDETLNYYFGEGFYTIDQFSMIDPEQYRSIFDSPALIKEWGLPERLVLIDGDGHTWLALDYRESKYNPKVIVMESDNHKFLAVSKTFDEFVQSLLLYEDVYDNEGNIIYLG